MLDLLSKNEDHRRHCRHVSATGEETARRRKFKSRRIQQKIICCCDSDALQVCQLLDMCQAYSTARHLLELRKVCGMCQEKKKETGTRLWWHNYAASCSWVDIGIQKHQSA